MLLVSTIFSLEMRINITYMIFYISFKPRLSKNFEVNLEYVYSISLDKFRESFRGLECFSTSNTNYIKYLFKVFIKIYYHYQQFSTGTMNKNNQEIFKFKIGMINDLPSYYKKYPFSNKFNGIPVSQLCDPSNLRILVRRRSYSF